MTIVKKRGTGALIVILLMLAPAGAWAQNASVASLSTRLGQAETDVRGVDRALDGRVDASDAKLLRARTSAARAAALDAAGQLQQQLGEVDARIAELGPPVPGIPDTPDILAQRTDLASQRTTLNAAVKRGGLVGVEARQIVDEIDRSQVQQLDQKLTTRYIPPLAPSFWANVLASAPRDGRRVALFVRQGDAQVRGTWRGGVPWMALAGLIVAFALMIPVRLAARRAGQRFLVDDAPGQPVRRSSYALWRVTVGTLAPLLATVAIVQGLDWSGLLPDRWSGVLDACTGAAGFGGYVGALGGALLLRDQPSWRLAPVGDAAAVRLRPIGWILTGLSVLAILWDAFNRAVGASSPALVATQAIEAVFHIVLIGVALSIVGRLRAERVASEVADASPGAVIGTGTGTGAGFGLAALVGWIALGVALIALLTGFIGFSLFLGQLVVWATILSASTWLLLTIVDDVATSVFVHHSALATTLTGALGIRRSAIDQFGVLLSAVIRVALVLLAFGLLLSPFGADSGPVAIFGRLGVLAQGVQIGGIAISPGAILRGVAVLFVGLTVLRVFMRWLEQRYLPITDLDGSGRNSVSLLARYIGVAIATIWALASLGIGVERLALLLSALSVGIGFGLQAITQNFVSGLILLFERPIKIGDLVRVGADEGDVRRISVRSTEIELADHSTLIVPNSELITKSVLNKTLSGPLGRMQIQFSVPLVADVEHARALTLAAFAAEPAVLAEPAPLVFIDSILDGRVLFNCFGHVASPRAAYSARSAVLLVLLRDLRAAGIEMGSVPQRLELVSQPPEVIPAPNA